MPAVTPAAPVITSPGALVDNRAFLQVYKAPIEPAVKLSTSSILVSCTTVIQSDWTNASYFTRATPQQNQMASATTEGQQAILSFSGLSSVLRYVSDSYTIASIRLKLALMMRWNANLSHPGTAAVRGLVYYKGEELFNGLWSYYPNMIRLPAAPAAVAVPTANVEWMGNAWKSRDSAHPYLSRAILAKMPKPFTIANLKAWGNDFQVILHSWVGVDAFSPTWHAGPLQMEIVYHNGTSPTQSHVQWRMGTSVPMTTLLWDSGKIPSASDTYTFPPNLASPDVATYLDCKVWNEADTASALGTSNFRSISNGLAELVHAQGAFVYFINAYPGKVFPTIQWTKTVGHTNVWQAPFNRATEPTVNFKIDDFEEQGVAKTYSAVSAYPASGTILAAVDATAKRWYHDEDGELATSGGVPTLYVHTSDNRAAGAWPCGALVARLSVTWSTRYLVWNDRNYEGRVVKMPSLMSSIGEILNDVSSAPTSTMVVSDHDGLFSRGVAHGMPPIDGWIWDGRKIEIRAALESPIEGGGPGFSASKGTGIGYAGSNYTLPSEAPIVHEGIMRWPDGDLIKDDRVEFKVAGGIVDADEVELGLQVYNEQRYPLLREDDSEKPIPEVYGGDSFGSVECAVVDPGPGSGGFKTTLRAAVESATLIELYIGNPSTPALTKVNSTYFTYTAPHIFATTAGQSWFNSNIGGKFYARCSGPAGYNTVGAVLRLMLQKHGIAASKIVTATFSGDDELDGICSLVVKGRTTVAATLHRLMRQSLHHIGRDIAGNWFCVRYKPTTLTSPTIIREFKIVGKPGWRLAKDQMGAQMGFELYPWQHSRRASDLRRTQNHRSFRSTAFNRLEDERTVSLDVAFPYWQHKYLLANALEVPERDVAIEVEREYLLATPGKTVMLDLEKVLGPGGTDAWGVFLVMERELSIDGTSKLLLRYAFSFAEADRPGVAL